MGSFLILDNAAEFWRVGSGNWNPCLMNAVTGWDLQWRCTLGRKLKYSA